MNLHAGPLQLAATSLILVSPFTKFALTLEPVARGVEELAQKVIILVCTSSLFKAWMRYAAHVSSYRRNTVLICMIAICL